MHRKKFDLETFILQKAADAKHMFKKKKKKSKNGTAALNAVNVSSTAQYYYINMD